jgi:hypothetical protein
VRGNRGIAEDDRKTKQKASPEIRKEKEKRQNTETEI